MLVIKMTKNVEKKNNEISKLSLRKTRDLSVYPKGWVTFLCAIKAQFYCYIFMTTEEAKWRKKQTSEKRLNGIQRHLIADIRNKIHIEKDEFV